MTNWTVIIIFNSWYRWHILYQLFLTYTSQKWIFTVCCTNAFLMVSNREFCTQYQVSTLRLILVVILFISEPTSCHFLWNFSSNFFNIILCGRLESWNFLFWVSSTFPFQYLRRAAEVRIWAFCWSVLVGWTHVDVGIRLRNDTLNSGTLYISEACEQFLFSWHFLRQKWTRFDHPMISWPYFSIFCRSQAYSW